MVKLLDNIILILFSLQPKDLRYIFKSYMNCFLAFFVAYKYPFLRLIDIAHYSFHNLKPNVNHLLSEAFIEFISWMKRCLLNAAHKSPYLFCVACSASGASELFSSEPLLHTCNQSRLINKLNIYIYA